MNLGTKPPSTLLHPANNKQPHVPLHPPQQGAYCEPSENNSKKSKKFAKTLDKTHNLCGRF